MADAKQKKLLLEDMSLTDAVSLNQTMNTPGFSVLVRLFEAACTDANADAIKTDPEDSDYNRLLAVRSQRARDFNEVVSYVRACAAIHVKRVLKAAEAETERVEEAVGATLGIHPAKPTKDMNAIEKTFGIHAAKPKKQAAK